MANVKVCDICRKELKGNDKNGIRIIKNNDDRISYYHDLCNDCYKIFEDLFIKKFKEHNYKK